MQLNSGSENIAQKVAKMILSRVTRHAIRTRRRARIACRPFPEKNGESEEKGTKIAPKWTSLGPLWGNLGRFFGCGKSEAKKARKRFSREIQVTPARGRGGGLRINQSYSQRTSMDTLSLHFVPQGHGGGYIIQYMRICMCIYIYEYS